MSKAKQKIVIVGGGFAGVKAALELCEDPLFDVTLISSVPDLRIYGSLYHVATGGSPRVSSIPLQEVFLDKPVTIVIDTAETIDRKSRSLTTRIGTTYAYNQLILALGVQTSYFGIEGLSEYSYGIKTLEEADELKKHLHSQLLNKKNEHSLHYVVVGGGPTGVELAGALPEYIHKISKWHGMPKQSVHIDLIEAAPRLLPRSPESVSKSVARNLKKLGIKIYLNTNVLGQTADELHIRGKPIRSHTVIWTAGMTNNPFFTVNNFQLTSRGKVRVDPYLQAEPDIYVLGDNADTAYSGMAQTALNDGKYVAQHLKTVAHAKDPTPYKAKKPIYVMPAGPKWAAVQWGSVHLYGRAGWMLRRAADFVAYKDYESWPMAFSRFWAENDHQEFCPICAAHIADS